MRELDELFKRKRSRYGFEKKNSKRALVLSPHADDETIGCGGTILKLLKEDWHIEVILFCHKEDRERREEFMQAHRCLGYHEIHYLDGQDGNIKGRITELSRKVRTIIDKLRPDVIFTPYILDQVDDHFAVNVCLKEVFDDLDLQGKTEIYMYEIWSLIHYPDFYIDITDLFEKKREVLLQYRSQEKKYQICQKSEYINSLRAQLSFRRKYIYTECFRKISHHEFTKAFHRLYG